ncbi:MAG TPA: hypothetical protein VLT47_11580 [Anaeromyxobacteraceae bacterium]|nr:hypothetical protein [Anaeromyxobacteraceae bacterium]
MTRNAVKGAFVAAAVCSMFTAGAARGQTAEKTKEAPKTVQCAGINACKGQGACAGAGHGCAGMNACKGKGWIETASAKECTDKGGKVISPRT